MALVNNKLNITELDFDLIKQNLIAYMQGQETFSDYNFAGSGLQILIDELAYNTHYGAYLVNMIANEMFISTAIVRDNIVKLAKSLGYTPTSHIGATGIIKVTVTPPNSNVDSSFSIPRYSSFISKSLSGVNYNFVTTETHTAILNENNQFVFNDVLIKEGFASNYRFTASVANPRNNYDIPTANIDTSTLLVNVIENSPGPPSTKTYIRATDVSLLDSNSRVYFLTGAEQGKYTLYFGDGILGKKPIPGDVIDLTYIVTNGEAGNFANNFSSSGPIGPYGNVIVQSLSSAGGGSFSEDAESIKNNAPKSYVTQERAVTLADYDFLLNRDYKNIGSLALWSGGENVPPIYGKIFLSIKPKFGNFLSLTEKQKVINILKKYNMPTVDPTIIDPDYTYILFDIEVNYDPDKTTLTSNQLIEEIRTEIIAYANESLGKFSTTYRESTLYNRLSTVDPSILGSDVEIFLQKRFFPFLGQSVTYTLNFFTRLHRGGLLEKFYSSPGALIYDGSGIPRTCFIEEEINTYQGINEIVINNPGFGYTGTPTVVINGDGFGATAHAVIVNGVVNNIIIDTPGEGYSFSTATISGGGGYGAIVTPVLAATKGILKTYYIDSSNKFFISNLQGTVDHINGVVTIKDFAPFDITNSTKMLSINVKPDRSFIIPTRNNILLLDPNDSKSIQIKLIPQKTT